MKEVKSDHIGQHFLSGDNISLFIIYHINAKKKDLL